jgi:ABC-2 type transport system ATP-binding protein
MTIDVIGLTKRFGHKVALDDVSFRVNSGRVTGFLGPNGAGKSTTFRAILGLDRPTAGTTLVAGRRYNEHPYPMRVVGAAMDAPSTHPGRTARHHLVWLAEASGIGVSRVNEMLEMVGLDAVANKRVGGFSLGMRQRLAIAAALLGDPQILLFDEPLNGLDPSGIAWARQLFRHLAAEGRTVFVSSHLMSEMAQTAEHVIVIGRGRVLADESRDRFLERSVESAVVVRSPDAHALQQLLTERGAIVTPTGDDSFRTQGINCETVGEIASANGLTLWGLATDKANLESAYFALTKEAVEFTAPPARSNAEATHG